VYTLAQVEPVVVSATCSGGSRTHDTGFKSWGAKADAHSQAHALCLGLVPKLHGTGVSSLTGQQLEIDPHGRFTSHRGFARRANSCTAAPLDQASELPDPTVHRHRHRTQQVCTIPVCPESAMRPVWPAVLRAICTPEALETASRDGCQAPPARAPAVQPKRRDSHPHPIPRSCVPNVQARPPEANQQRAPLLKRLPPL
jgi:hypothetical protein